MVEDAITLYPVVGWDFGVLPAGDVAFYVQWIPGVPGPQMTTADVHRAVQVHRFQMTAEQCDELAKALQQVASKSREGRSAWKQ